MSAVLDTANRWDDPAVESMYDKTLLRRETALIKRHIEPGASVCDMGCGEGEATAEYATVDGVTVDAFDSSRVRLDMARARVGGNVTLRCGSVMDKASIQYDCVISQRLLINLPSWSDQRIGIKRLSERTKSGGVLILSEGSVQGVQVLNDFRELYGLPPIPVPEHNVFMYDNALALEAAEHGLRLWGTESLGAYYMLTRGVQPALRDKCEWESAFNVLSASDAAQRMLACARDYARVKIWIFRKK